MDHAIALLELRDHPTAIATANDLFAKAVYDAAAHKGIRIPEGLSVIGFGNLPFCESLTPRLTTVDKHPYEIGQSAARRVLTRIANPSERPRKILLQPNLIVRESAAPPRKALKTGVAR